MEHDERSTSPMSLYLKSRLFVTPERLPVHLPRINVMTIMIAILIGYAWVRFAT